MKKKIILWLSAAFCLLFLSGKVSAQKTVRIVSLSPSISYTLQQLDADDQIVGRTSYCPAPQKGNTSTIIGNVLEINLEKILLLKPDIVFSMSFTKAEIREKMEKMGIRIQDFPTPRSFEEICQQTLLIGKLAGKEAAARKMVSEETGKVEQIRREAESLKQKYPSRKTFFQIGERPVFPVIEGTYMNQYLTLLGLENIVKDYKGGGISKEYVLAARPDIMFISKMSGMGEKAMREWMDYAQIPAVADKRITLVDDNLACCPTPVFFRMTLESLFRYLNANR